MVEYIIYIMKGKFFMEIRDIKIAKGVTLHYIKDTKYKTVSMSVFLRRPLEKETATLNALLAGVLKQGTNKLNNMKDISRYMSDLYGAGYDISVFKTGSTHNLSFDISFLSEKYLTESIEKRCVDFLFDLIFDSKCIGQSFDESDVETDKNNLRDDIDSIINSKREYAEKRLNEIMFEGETASIPSLGYKEEIDKISAGSLYEYYRKIIFESPIDIYIVGEVDFQKVSEDIKERLSSYEFNICDVSHRFEIRGAGDVKNVEEKMDVTQGKLCIGMRTNISKKDDDYFAFVVANSILGAGAHSKLFNNVREKLSLCYYVYSRFSSLDGAVKIDAGIEFDKVEEAKKEIFNQIECVKSGDFSDDEFKAAKEFLIDRYKKYTDSPGAIMQYLYTEEVTGIKYTIEEMVERVGKVTREEAVKAISKLQLDTVYFLKGKDIE
ncbi:MAG: insulinase family protein [Ruminococcaceae bacterium]|nr:insulinase family protein [Oscillospiraceae bacterium]